MSGQHRATTSVSMQPRALPLLGPRGRAKPHRFTAAIFAGLLGCLILDSNAFPAAPGGNLITYLQERFGLKEGQVRGALGALLVYAQDRLPKGDFDDLCQNVPNAQRIVEDVKLRGIVTRPLDDVDDYEASLSSLGIGQPLASQIAPAVLNYLEATGHDHERDILAGVL